MPTKYVLTTAVIALAVVLAEKHVSAKGGVKNAARIGN
jgi:hypothetical protein